MMTEIRSILEASSNLQEREADRVQLVLFAGCTKASSYPLSLADVMEAMKHFHL